MTSRSLFQAAGFLFAEILLILSLWKAGSTALWVLVAAVALASLLLNIRATRRLLRTNVAGSRPGQVAVIWLVPIAGALLIEDLLEGAPTSPGVEVDYGALEDANVLMVQPDGWQEPDAIDGAAACVDGD